MNEEKLKPLLIRDKGFFRELYSGPNALKNKRILFSADDSKLNTLIKYLHFLTNGQIDIPEDQFEKIESSKKIKFIQKMVEKRTDLMNLLNKERSEKIKFLLKLSALYPHLLYPLFNLE